MSPRITVAETGTKPPYQEPRIAWFWFVYDWETRSKTVIERDDLFAHPDKLSQEYPPNTHVYKIQVELPPPVSERTGIERVLPIEADHVSEEEATKTPVKPEDTAYHIARGLFFHVGDTLPKGTYVSGGGAGTKFGGPDATGTWDVHRPGFEVTCPAGKYRVTVTKIEE